MTKWNYYFWVTGGVILFIINIIQAYFIHDETPLGYPSLYLGQGLILLLICCMIGRIENKD